MGLISRLQAKIAAAVASRDVEALRDSLIDETDSALSDAPDRRRWYGRVWDRFSEFDYGHIDQERLLAELGALSDAAPNDNDVVVGFARFETYTVAGASVTKSFEPHPSPWAPNPPTTTEAPPVTVQAEAEVPWAVHA